MARSYYLGHYLILKLENVCSKHFAEIDFIKTTSLNHFQYVKMQLVLLWFDDEKCFQ